MDGILPHCGPRFDLPAPVQRISVAFWVLLPACGPVLDTGRGNGTPCTASASVMENNPLGVLVTTSCSRPVELDVSWGREGELDGALPPRAAAAGVHEFALLGLYTGTTVQVQVNALEAGEAWAIGPLEVAVPDLPDDWPDCKAESFLGESPLVSDEAICFAGGQDRQHRAILCYDRSGRPIWAVSLPSIQEPLFLRPLVDGTLALMSANQDLILVLDETSRVVSRVTSLDLVGTRYTHQLIDGHDMLPITEGPWAGSLAFLTVSFETLTHGETAAGSGIVVLDPMTREILWDWSILGDLEDGLPIDPAIECSNRNNCYTGNAILHGVGEDGEQFFWLERNRQDEILRVDVATGRIDWVLGADGDFRLVDDLDAADPRDLSLDSWMVNPHAPEILDRSGHRTRFFVYDNGHHSPDGAQGVSSRIVEYEIDESSRLATIRFTYGGTDATPNARWFSPAGGNVEMLPQQDRFVFLNGTGSIFVSEIGYPSGQERWRLTCGEGGMAYRLAYFPSLYDTTWKYSNDW